MHVAQKLSFDWNDAVLEVLQLHIVISIQISLEDHISVIPEIRI
jgi:hypothetical protein